LKPPANSLQLPVISVKLRNIALQTAAYSLKLRNIGLQPTAYSLKLRNICLKLPGRRLETFVIRPILLGF